MRLARIHGRIVRKGGPGLSARIEGYDLTAVTRDSFLASVSRVLGPDVAQAKWSEACAAVALRPDLPDYAPEDLERVAKAFVEMGGLASVVGSSMYVRIVTYRTLSNTRTARAGGGNE